MTKEESCLGFSVFPGIGPAIFSRLCKHFGDARGAWNANKKELLNLELNINLINKFIRFRNSFSPEIYTKKLREKSIKFLVKNSIAYPGRLMEIPNPPIGLYQRGSFDFNSANHKKTIAVVGTRKISPYGQDVTEMITHGLVSYGFTIISGLALGVDTVAHITAVENKAHTVGVLGCGVDCCFPRENVSLYHRIIDGSGCVVSELPLGHPPTKGSFPSRNRIIAGLSTAVVVTEGAEDSGSLITAEYAFKFGRKVFAVPGPITSFLSKGPYKLIQKGAKLVTSAEDIIKELGFKSTVSISVATGKKKIIGETKEEQMVLDLLQNETMYFDELVRKMNSNSSKLGSILSIMEIKGFIKTLTSGEYSLR